MAEKSNNRMNVEFKGELEGISRPQSNRLRPGSKPVSSTIPSATSSAVNAVNSRLRAHGLTSSLQLLSPEEVCNKDYELELEDLGSDSYEYTDNDDDDDDDDTLSNANTGRTSELFNITEPFFHAHSEKLAGVMRQESQNDDDDDFLVARQLALFENETETEIEVSSDEERDIIDEIRAEITNQVKGEMRDELEVYREAKERLVNEDPKEEDPLLEGLDPRVKEAILKMRKLDKILEKKIRKEKEVKKDRILLQRRLRKELEELEQGKKSATVEEKRNMEKFLALALPPSHNMEVSSDVGQLSLEFRASSAERSLEEETGVLLDEDEGEPAPVTPVFQTQVPDDEMLRSRKKESAKNQARGDHISSAGPSTHRTEETSSSISGATSASKNSSGSRAEHKKKKRKDFIKRNMELAADAASTIAMTDDEKKRIEDLLGDLDTLPEIPEDLPSVKSRDHSSNPYQITLSTNEGFHPSADEIKCLDAIDERLKALLPPEDFESICSTPSSVAQSDQGKTTLFIRSQRPSDLEIDIDRLGEQALKDNKEHRDLQQRLHDIEDELTAMTKAVEMEMECPSLSEGQLQELLDQCARTMSRASAETNTLSTSRSGLTATQLNIYDNPPKLPADVLQSLLADARRSIMGSATPTMGGASSRSDNDLVIESVNEETMKELLQNPRATSRSASRGSLRSQLLMVSDDSKEDESLHRERKPFLPEIDPKGRMSTQKLNNDEPYSGPPSSRSSAITVHNRFAGSTAESPKGLAESYESGDLPTPHPPTDAKKSSAGRSRNRNSSELSAAD